MSVKHPWAYQSSVKPAVGVWSVALIVHLIEVVTSDKALRATPAIVYAVCAGRISMIAD